mmetsp:Transcript_40800/g.86386  ORF Transcript_40800/g.86386 Transcript_40800/m.86386 type:complete len:294 (-) Transcript_40800:60-941(-)
MQRNKLALNAARVYKTRTYQHSSIRGCWLPASRGSSCGRATGSSISSCCWRSCGVPPTSCSCQRFQPPLLLRRSIVLPNPIPKNTLKRLGIGHKISCTWTLPILKRPVISWRSWGGIHRLLWTTLCCTGVGCAGSCTRRLLLRIRRCSTTLRWWPWWQTRPWRQTIPGARWSAACIRRWSPFWAWGCASWRLRSDNSRWSWGLCCRRLWLQRLGRRHWLRRRSFFILVGVNSLQCHWRVRGNRCIVRRDSAVRSCLQRLQSKKKLLDRDDSSLDMVPNLLTLGVHDFLELSVR